MVIYLRVSTEDQARRGYSLPEQLEACNEKAKSLAAAYEQQTGLDVDLQTVVFKDTVSGELLERPELEKVRAFVRGHRPAYFVCLDPDRFSRATYQAILVANEIEAAGTKLEFVQHDYQNTPEGKLFFTLRVAIAEYEKSKIKERSLRGKRGKMKRGGLPNGLNMFGYIWQKEADEVVPHPTEAEWVSRVFLWASEGVGCQVIANRLNAAGVHPKRKASKWYRGTVSKLLRNRGYVGELQLNRYDTTGLAVQRQLPKARRTVVLTPTQRPQEEWITVNIPPLISRECWDRVNQLRGDGVRRRQQQATYFLSGLAECGFCGGPIHYRPHKTLGHMLMCANRYPYMRDLKEPLLACRSLPHQKASPFETQVWSKVKEWLTDPDVLQDHLQQLQAGTETASAADQIRGELDLVERQLAQKQREQGRMLAVVATGSVDPQVAAEQLRPYTEQIENLKQTATRLRERLAVVEWDESKRLTAVRRVRDLQEAIAAESQSVAARLEALGPDRRRELVRMVVHRVILFPQGICQIEPHL